MQNEPNVQLEYRVVPVTRFIVTRFESGNNSVGSEQRGEYDNADVAHELAYALCKMEHDKLGWEPGDMRIRYPHKPLGEAVPA